MGFRLADAFVRVSVDDSGLDSELDQTEGTVSNAFGGIGTVAAGAMLATLGTALVSGFINTLRTLKDFAVNEAIPAAQEQLQAERKLEAVLRATGGAAGFTASEIRNMAAEMQKVTNFGDETVISAAAVLATFKELNGDVFQETLGLAADMASVLDGDINTSVLQLGRALNDPIAGLTALSRSGVSFTEGQKEQIRNYVEMGDLLSAQRVILDELQSEFGGAAEAMADPIEQSKNLIGDLTEDIGFVLLPTVNAVLEGFMAWTDELGNTRDMSIVIGEVLQRTLALMLEDLVAIAEVLQVIPGVNAAAGLGELGGGALRKLLDDLLEIAEARRKMFDQFRGGPTDRPDFPSAPDLDGGGSGASTSRDNRFGFRGIEQLSRDIQSAIQGDVPSQQLAVAEQQLAVQRNIEANTSNPLFTEPQQILT